MKIEVLYRNRMAIKLCRLRRFSKSCKIYCGGKFQCFAHQLLRSYALFLWRHEDTSLLCLLSDDNSCRQVTTNFSLR